MIKLSPPTLQVSDRHGAATKELLVTYEKLINGYAKNPLLTASKRVLTELGVPKSLHGSVVFGTEIVTVWEQDPSQKQEPVLTTKVKRLVGFASSAFDSALYASDDIKDALITTHEGRCAYCESYLRHVSHGDVEHFRPKAGCAEHSQEGLNRDAYFWLAYEPTNLLLACQICNEVHKGNLFPVLGDRLQPGTFDVTQEKQVLIDPYREDPREFIRFNPLTGKAYDFKLLSAALLDMGKANTPQEAEQYFWLEPKLIDELPRLGDFQSWLQSHHDPQLSRGMRTIDLLALNRPELIRARISHLRHLRGLVWTSMHEFKTGDVNAAKDFCVALAQRNYLQLAPEYLSATIDALCTWYLRRENNKDMHVAQEDINTIELSIQIDELIPHYNEMLVKLPQVKAREVETDPSTYNDSIAYFIPENDINQRKYRRLVYISDANVYGNNDEPAGYFLAIDWEQDKNREIGAFDMEDGSPIDSHKQQLKDLLKIDSKQLWRFFNNAYVTVEGPFDPLG